MRLIFRDMWMKRCKHQSVFEKIIPAICTPRLEIRKFIDALCRVSRVRMRGRNQYDKTEHCICRK
jgi:hypothetical protein